MTQHIRKDLMGITVKVCVRQRGHIAKTGSQRATWLFTLKAAPSAMNWGQFLLRLELPITSHWASSFKGPSMPPIAALDTKLLTRAPLGNTTKQGI